MRTNCTVVRICSQLRLADFHSGLFDHVEPRERKHAPMIAHRIPVGFCILAGVFYWWSGIAYSQQQPTARGATSQTSTSALLEKPKAPADVSISMPLSVPAAPADSAPEAASPQSIPTVRSTVIVDAAERRLENGLAVPFHITRKEVLSSAGTWGDFTRFLQLLPGVVWNTDTSNDVLVQGGNPSENLYVVDGIEVPNINQIALEGTTGGFTSMVDTSTIQSVDMQAGAYDSQYDSRLSSLIEIHTRRNNTPRRTGEFNVGISGAGGLLQNPFGSAGKRGSLLLAAHRSILNLVTNDIGLNGVPIYTNGMAQMRWAPDSRDSISALSLTGGDSININPSACDYGLDLFGRTEYAGLRSTNGVVWKHVHSPTSLSTVTVSFSDQGQDIGQQRYTNFCKKVIIQPVYSEHTRDRVGMLGYGFRVGSHHWLMSLGTTAHIVNLSYAVSQPLGQQSPFNPAQNWTDSDNFDQNVSALDIGTYAEVTGQFGTKWTAIAGSRFETYGIIASHEWNPHASVAFRIDRHQGINVSFSRSAQLVPYIDLLSYPGNRQLQPVVARELSFGGDLWRGNWTVLSLEAYDKRYSHEAVSTEYPGLMLANMVDTLGQQFIWLPLKSGGRGTADGIEMQLRAHVPHRAQFMGSATYSRLRYAAADGIYRPGNFDFPLVGNGLVTINLWKGIEISMRDTYATGRPYTPFNIQLSERQHRGIYDLTQINARRGSAYNRLDADINRSFHVGKGVLNIHGGVENALQRQNFLGYAWMDTCRPTPTATQCGLTPNAFPGIPETELTQMPTFPSGAITYRF